MITLKLDTRVAANLLCQLIRQLDMPAAPTEKHPITRRSRNTGLQLEKAIKTLKRGQRFHYHDLAELAGVKREQTSTRMHTFVMRGFLTKSPGRTGYYTRTGKRLKIRVTI